MVEWTNPEHFQRIFVAGGGARLDLDPAVEHEPHRVEQVALVYDMPAPFDGTYAPVREQRSRDLGFAREYYLQRCEEIRLAFQITLRPAALLMAAIISGEIGLGRTKIVPPRNESFSALVICHYLTALAAWPVELLRSGAQARAIPQSGRVYAVKRATQPSPGPKGLYASRITNPFRSRP
ncbi:hypothetical protein [Sphingomonas psychrotolerans]|uniref:hypothetical protein n=1 Tax=Sphingomonas psychrotolerans TaxID=1327635 RepID=UPI00130527B2|nr:hypothetical protein [Sphingomonas psychrotolerans]